MLCDICQEREATLFIKKIENGEKMEYNLCEICSSNLESPSISLNDIHENIFSGLTDMLVGFSDMKTEGKIEGELKCTNCGFTSGDFMQSGRLGCSNCYRIFEDKLTSLLRRLQGAVQHAGKSPPGAEKFVEIKKIKSELQKAIEREEYERAAVLRDKLKELDKKRKDKPRTPRS